MRTARAAPLCLSGRGAHGLLQLHRRLLQSHPAALRPGVSLAHLLRTGDANRPTVRHPLNRPPKRGNFMAKASRSYPPVASSATKPTWCSLQNAINSMIPAPSLVKPRVAPSQPSRTSSAAEQTSTPQIRSVTVTCLVHAIDNR